MPYIEAGTVRPLERALFGTKLAPAGTSNGDAF
jgi:hypothetical protein